ncbi:MAG: TadE/TadG family type IV pilus assembly protein [Betaproteobacteria bacterium]
MTVGQVSRTAARLSARRRFFFLKTKSDLGAAAVEFALILPVFLLMLFFMLDAGRFMLVQMSLTSAAQNGSRAIAYGADTSTVASLVQASIADPIVRLSTLNSSSSATSVKTGMYVCPLNSENYVSYNPLTGLTTTIPDGNCTDLSAPANSAISCQTVLSNYRAKATASLTFKWLTPIYLFTMFLDPSLVGPDGSILQNSKRDLIPIVGSGKILCQK